MNRIMDIVKGMMIGIANIIPGVSGGTMALSMGIYDKLIGAVSNLFHDWKKSIATLFPILLGCGIGIIGFSYLIEYLLSEQTFATCMAFIGLILGGLPMLFRKLKEKQAEQGQSIGVSGVLCFVLLFALAIGMCMLDSGEEVMKTLTATPRVMIALFFIGIIASATMVVPGVSGSMVLMILGYYYGILDSITGFLNALKDFNIPVLIDKALVLIPFGIGVLLGIFLIAKLITFLFEKYGVQTYCAILGLILSSPIAIFYNTGLFGQLGQLNIFLILSGLLIAAVCGIIAYFLGEQ